MIFNSKQVKPDYMSEQEDKHGPGCIWCPPKNLLKRAWWKVERFFRPVRRFYHFILKVYAYSKVLWYDFDWESAYLYPILELKLTRILKALKTGHLVQDERSLKALEMAIMLCGRLKDDHEYYDRPMRRHDRKWGKLRMRSGKPDKKGNTRCLFSRAKVKTTRQKNQERKEFRTAYEVSDFLQDRDRRILFGIMAKYLPMWWD